MLKKYEVCNSDGAITITALIILFLLPISQFIFYICGLRYGKYSFIPINFTLQMEKNGILKRNNVTVIGKGEQTLLLAHGFGCDQNMWRYVTPAFVDRY